jgi:hypothetical protein
LLDAFMALGDENSASRPLIDPASNCWTRPAPDDCAERLRRTTTPDAPPLHVATLHHDFYHNDITTRRPLERQLGRQLKTIQTTTLP